MPSAQIARSTTVTTIRNTVTGELIRSIRIERKWNQSELAERAGGIDRTVVSAMENGRRLRPAYVERICAALGVTIEDFMREVSDRTAKRHEREYREERADLAAAATQYGIFAESLDRLRLSEHQNRLAEARNFVLELRTRLPELRPQELAWANHAIGDALLSAGEAEEAAKYFEQARDGFFALMHDAQFQLARTYNSLTNAPARSDRDKWRLKALREMDRSRHWDTGDLHPKTLADHYKSYAELLERSEEEVDRTEARELFAAAKSMYAAATATFRDSARPSREQLRHQAHCEINYGYCARKLGQPAEALESFVRSIELRIRLNEQYEVAYIFKMLALTYRDLGDWRRAGWCANVAVKLYATDQGTTPNKDDAARVLGEIVGTNREATVWFDRFPLLDVGALNLLLEAYHSLSSEPNSSP